MCFLFAHKAGALSFTDEEITIAWTTNHDGAGLAYLDKDGIQVRKFLKLGMFLNAYHKVMDTYSLTSPVLGHMRFATHGSVGHDNIHPFSVCQGKAVMAHNGVLNIYIPTREWSDTKALAYLLNPTDLEDLKTTKGQKELEFFIGRGNKLVFLGADGSLTIVNAQIGHWISADTWASNHGYQVMIEPKMIGWAGYGHSYKWDDDPAENDIPKPKLEQDPFYVIATGITKANGFSWDPYKKYHKAPVLWIDDMGCCFTCQGKNSQTLNDNPVAWPKTIKLTPHNLRKL